MMKNNETLPFCRVWCWMSLLFLMLTISSCSFREEPLTGKEEWKLNIDKKELVPIVLDKVSSVYPRNAKAEGAEKLMMVSLAKVANGGEGTFLMEDIDGGRYYLALTNKDPKLPPNANKKFLNKGYHHYVHYTNMVGKNTADVVKEWGEYFYCTYENNTTTDKLLHYPHIWMVNGHEYTKGVKLLVDKNWIVKEVRHNTSTSYLFGYLPFYEDIICTNYMAAFSEPMWVDSYDGYTDSEIFPFISDLFYGVLFMLCIILVYVVLVALVASLGEEEFVPMWFLYLLYFIIVIPVYPLLIMILNEYHSAWWILAIGALCLLCLPIMFYVVAKPVECTRCGGRKWNSGVLDDKSRKTEEEYEIRYDKENDTFSRVLVRKIPKVKMHVCRKCRNMRREPFIENEVVKATYCPHCGKVRIDENFTTTIKSGNDLIIKDACTYCNFRYTLTVRGYYKNTSSQSATPYRRSSSSAQAAQPYNGSDSKRKEWYEHYKREAEAAEYECNYYQGKADSAMRQADIDERHNDSEGAERNYREARQYQEKANYWRDKYNFAVRNMNSYA